MLEAGAGIEAGSTEPILEAGAGIEAGSTEPILEAGAGIEAGSTEVTLEAGAGIEAGSRALTDSVRAASSRLGLAVLAVSLPIVKLPSQPLISVP